MAVCVLESRGSPLYNLDRDMDDFPFEFYVVLNQTPREALHSFGSVGKLAVETSIIGLLIGTCVAFYVIIGDLGPSIVSKWFGFENSWSLRTGLLIILSLCVVMPLGMLRRVEQLSSISALSLSFYTVLIAQIVLISFPTLLSFSWVSYARYWRPEGLFKCLSIFALAFVCHTQVFVVYESLPDRTERKMNDVVKGAVNMVTFCYIMVGFFGYVAFCEQGIKGDILMNFKTSFVNDLLKLGFVVSVVLSFPMMIFPCRASINTLLSGSEGVSLENPGGGHEHIPSNRFKGITVFIVILTLIIGIAIPNVETILGLTGATTGIMIGFIFPATMFLKCLPKGPGVKSAQLVLFLGIIIMFASTYSTLMSRPDVSQAVEPANIPDFDVEKLKINEPVNLVEEEIGNREVVLPDGDDVIKDTENENAYEQMDTGNGDGIAAVEHAKSLVVEGKGEEKLHAGKLEDDNVDVLVDENVGERGKRVEVFEGIRQEPPVPHAPNDSEEKENGVNIQEKKDLPDDKFELVMPEVQQIQGGPDDRGPNGQEIADLGEKKEHVIDEDDDEAHKRLEEKVEEKVKEQEQKHEEQQKMIDNLQEKQDKQEKIIEQQQEIIDQLKKQHDSIEVDEKNPNPQAQDSKHEVNVAAPAQHEPGLVDPAKVNAPDKQSNDINPVVAKIDAEQLVHHAIDQNVQPADGLKLLDGLKMPQDDIQKMRQDIQPQQRDILNVNDAEIRHDDKKFVESPGEKKVEVGKDESHHFKREAGDEPDDHINRSKRDMDDDDDDDDDKVDDIRKDVDVKRNEEEDNAMNLEDILYKDHLENLQNGAEEKNEHALSNNLEVKEDNSKIENQNAGASNNGNNHARKEEVRR
uniref:Sodium-coupled neutral amino acid transporter 10-like n=1 Tax=Saccoglossus kowalevskii TaxID=10224 RepID=A0ABM0M1P9_SACKO|nr:PREDICTED: putative sodium-coupled neutral amino acid transporter 10-like [Saccoglossus kowalevskii]